jgi:hypothetical protein
LTLNQYKPVETEVRKYDTKQTYNWREYVITVEVANEKERYFEGQTVFQSTRRLDGRSMTFKEITNLLKRGYRTGQWQSNGVDRWRMGNYAVAQYYRMDRMLIEKLRRR